MRLLLCAAAPLCLFASQAYAQDILTASGTCTASEQVDEVLREKIGTTKSRTVACDTMVSVAGKSVTFTRKDAPQDRTVFTGATDDQGDLGITSITFGTAAAIPVELGFCNGGPVGNEGRTAMVCSAVYTQGSDKVGVSVVFQGTPSN
jgi:hypothetical protein